MCHNVTFEVAVFVLYCICISTQFLPVKLSYRKCNIKYCEHGVCSELLLGLAVLSQQDDPQFCSDFELGIGTLLSGEGSSI